mgnify:CR=1 FL=1
MVITVDMPDEMRKRLDIIKDRTGMSLSVLIRAMVKRELESGSPLTVSLEEETHG